MIGKNQSTSRKHGNCEICLKNKEPITGRSTLESSCCRLICEIKGKTYLVMQAFYGWYTEAVYLSKISSKAVVEEMKIIFARYGIPGIIKSDNGPKFKSSLIFFFKCYIFKWVNSSPRYVQSNGQVESAVKLVKGIIKKGEDPNLGLMSYRNTALTCWFLPKTIPNHFND